MNDFMRQAYKELKKLPDNERDKYISVLKNPYLRSMLEGMLISIREEEKKNSK